MLDDNNHRDEPAHIGIHNYIGHESPKVSKKDMENAYKLLDIYQKENKKLQEKLYEDGHSIE